MKPTILGPNGETFTPPPETFWLAYRGSISHGMFIPSTDPNSIDDIDLMGFVFGPREHYLGLSAWGSRGTKDIKDGPWDVVLYEIRKAVGLLLQGNPNIMSMLWVAPEHTLMFNSDAAQLKENRHLFLGKHIYNAFAGYAHEQLKKMESRDPADLRLYMALTAEAKSRGIHPQHKGEFIVGPGVMEREPTGEESQAAVMSSDKVLQHLASYAKKGSNIGYLGDKRKQLVLEHGYDSKNAAHLIRLLRMSVEFFKTGEMNVLRPDAAELLDIKRGKWALQAIKDHAAELTEEAKAARDASNLPEGPDFAGAEKLVVRLLSERFSQC